MKKLKNKLAVLLLLLCFSCKNSNSESVNADETSIENSTKSTKSEPELVNNWADTIGNAESNQDSSNEYTSDQEYVDENLMRCIKCNTELVTPSNRACYYCNRNFSGWGFIKRDGDVNNEQSESIVDCIPEFNIHNSHMWSLYEDACCSRRCAMDL